MSHQFIGNVPQPLDRFQLQSCLKLIDNISYRLHRSRDKPNNFSGESRRLTNGIKMAALANNHRCVERDCNLCRYRSLLALRCLCILGNCNSPSCGGVDDGGAWCQDERRRGWSNLWGGWVLIATTNRQTDAIPFPRRGRDTRSENCIFYILHRTKPYWIISFCSGVLQPWVNINCHLLNRILVNNSFLVDETSIINKVPI